MEWDWKSVRERRVQADEPQPAETDASGVQPEVEPEKSRWSWRPVSKARVRRTGSTPHEWEGLAWRPLEVNRTGKGRRGSGAPELTYHGVYDCAYCGGTGERPPGGKCPVCRNSGQVRVKPPAIDCAFCKGRGEVPPRSGVTCIVCKGKGHVTVKEPIETCGRCHGRARKTGEALYCLDCKGAGVVTVKGKGVDGARPARVSVLPSEREVLWALDELEGTGGKTAIGRSMGVSSAYSAYLCDRVAGKGLIERVDRGVYALTPLGEAEVRKHPSKEKQQEQREKERALKENEEKEQALKQRALLKQKKEKERGLKQTIVIEEQEGEAEAFEVRSQAQ